MPKPEDKKEYIVEYIALGNSMKVTAFDPETLKEVSVVVPPHMSKEESGQLAVRKLTYLLNKRKKPS